MPDRDEQNVVLLTAAEVAAILRLKNARAVYKLAKRHRWGFQRIISGRCVRYERRGLLRWIRRRPSHPRQHHPALDTPGASLHTCAEEGRDTP